MRNRWARLVPWLLPVVVLGGLQVVATSALRSGSGSKEIDRWFPRALGTTWLYSSRSGGEGSGTHLVQVVAAGRTVDGQATVLEGRWDDLLGRGPARQVQYQAVAGDRVVLHGQRFGGSFVSYDPPQPLWTEGLAPGGSFTWTGTFGTEEQQVTTTFGEEAAMTVAGTAADGCRHYRSAIVVKTAAGDAERSYESWLCPGIGAVRTVERAPDLGVVLEEELIGFLSATRRLGTVSAPPDAAGPHTTLPGDVDLTRVAWSDNRKELAKFPPVGRDGLLVVAEHDGTVSATDTTTGEVLWRVAVAAPVPVGPVLAGAAVVVAGADKSLSALDAATGVPFWSVRLPDVAATEPLVTGDLVVVAGQDRRVRAFALADGARRWVAATGDIPASPPVAAGGLVVVADKAGGVAGLRRTDGEVQWSAALERRWAAGPAPAGDDVVVMDRAGIVSAFDGASGDLTWSRYIELDVDVPLVVAGDLVLLVPNGDRIRALDRRDGTSRWQARLGATTSVAPVVAGDGVVVVTDAGRLQRRSLADGSLVEDLDPGPPTPASAVRVEVAPAWVGSQLVVTRDVDLPWPRTDLLAFGPPAAPAGARLTGELRRTEGLATGVPRLAGAALLLPADQGVTVVPPSGPARTILSSDATVPYAVPAGDLVLAPRGQDLVAVPVAGGEPRWSLPVGAPTSGAEPVVAGDRVLAPIAGAGLASVDLASGAPRWIHPTPGAQGTGAPVALPDGDVVYAVGGLVRLDGTTGVPRWSVPGVTVFGPVAVAAGVVVAAAVTAAGSFLLAVDLATGAERWRRPFNPSPLVGPAAGAGVVVAVDAGGATVALDAASGRPLWAYPMRTAPSATPAIVGERVVLSEAGREEDLLSRDTRLTVHDLRTGRYLAALEPAGFAFLTGTSGVSSGAVTVPVGTGVMILRLA